jgi:hypothetical protein
MGQVYGGYTWAFLLLAAGMAVTAWQGRTAQQAETTSLEPNLKLAA